MKKSIFSFSLLAILFATSCQKNLDQVSNEANSLNAANVDDAKAVKLENGGFVTTPDNSTTDFKISVLSKLNAANARTSIEMDEWNGKWFDYSQFTANGFGVFGNIVYSRGYKDDPAPFPTNIQNYTDTLNQILTAFPVKCVVVENEETDVYRHTGPIQDYINELTAATSVAHNHGLMVTNGGLSTRPLTFLVFRYLWNKGEYDQADTFAAHCIPDQYLYPLQHPGHNLSFDAKINRYDSLVQAYKNIPIDYVNIHIYEPIKYRCVANSEALSANVTQATPGALEQIVQYLKVITGKKAMSNEMGQMNEQPDLVTSMLDACKAAKLKYVIWYSGDAGSSGAWALHNPDGSLRSNGNSFKNYQF